MAKAKAMADVRVRLPLKLFNQIEELMIERGLTIDETIALYLRALVTASKRNMALGLYDEMDMGKYKGTSVDVICRTEPKYMIWMIGQGIRKFHPEVLNLLEEMSEDD